MGPILLHLWGPIAIHSYGFFIAVGLLLFIFLVKRDQRFKRLALESVFFDALAVSILSAFMGGRLLYILSEHEHINSFLDFFAFWQGGLAILGGVMGTLMGLSLFLYYKKVPVLPFFDLMAVYAPLLQAVSRMGCFFAGCCYGIRCTYWWAVQYTDAHCFAPTDILLHPTQLYSALLLVIIFLWLFFYLRTKQLAAGYITGWYLILISTERFLVDFYRDSRCMVTHYFSYNQLVAIGLIMCGLLCTFFLAKKSDKRSLYKDLL